MYISQFIEYAELNPAIEFLVTPIGTGIAGYSLEQMDEIWNKYNLPANIKLL